MIVNNLAFITNYIEYLYETHCSKGRENQCKVRLLIELLYRFTSKPSGWQFIEESTCISTILPDIYGAYRHHYNQWNEHTAVEHVCQFVYTSIGNISKHYCLKQPQFIYFAYSCCKPSLYYKKKKTGKEGTKRNMGHIAFRPSLRTHIPTKL